MSEDKQIKKNFFYFFKSFVVSGFLILFIEAAQLHLRLNYQHSYAPFSEVLKLAGFFLIIAVFLSFLLSLFFAILSRGRAAGFLRGIAETLSVSVIVLVWIPGLTVFIFTRDFPRTMKKFWLGDYGVIPILIVIAVLALRLIFKKRFVGEFNGLVRLLWKPVVVVAVVAFVWITAGAFISSPHDIKTKKLAAKSSAGQTKPNVILITFDALSARDMPLHGYHLNTTPTIDALAKESFVFSNARASSNITIPSVVSILTGKYPWTHEVFTEGQDHIAKSEKGENLAALLGDHYTSAIVSTNHALPPLLGFGGQFDLTKWSDHGDSPVVSSLAAVVKHTLKIDTSPVMMPIVRHFLFIDAVWRDLFEIEGQTFDKARNFIEETDERPFFLWMHVWPPHRPYSPPLPFLGKFLPYIPEEEDAIKSFPGGAYGDSDQALVSKRRLRYDEHIAFADYMLSTFTGYLLDAGLYDNSILIVSSDHGESFERGWNSHGSPYLWEQELHVPLIIHLPGQRRSHRVPANAEGVDIAPTILDLLGKKAPAWMEGESLVPYMNGDKKASEKTKFSFTHRVREIDIKGQDGKKEKVVTEAIAAYKGGFKLLYDFRSGDTALFNIKEDPGETKNIAIERRDIVRELWGDIKGAVKTRELP